MREYCFPAAPEEYISRLKDFLLCAFLPQTGPLHLPLTEGAPPELISRPRAWEIATMELALLNCSQRPLDGVHAVVAEVVNAIIQNEFPLSVPPRWIAELFSLINHLAHLRMRARGWTLEVRASEDLDPNCRD